MFDKTVYKTETTVTPVTRVIEKSITPDKVTDMYDKVQKEVLENIVRKGVIKTDNLNDISFLVFEEVHSGNKVLKVSFKINGKDYGFKRVIDLFECSNHQIIDHVFEVYKEEVARLLFKDALPKMAEIAFKNKRSSSCN